MHAHAHARARTHTTRDHWGVIGHTWTHTHTHTLLETIGGSLGTHAHGAHAYTLSDGD